MSITGKMDADRKCEIAGVLLLGLTVLLGVALLFDGHVGPRTFEGMSEGPNLLGTPGAFVAGALDLAVGEGGHAVYAITLIWSLMLFSHRRLDRFLTRLVGLFVVTFAAAGLAQVNSPDGAALFRGGAVGAFVSEGLLVKYFGVIGANVVAVTVGVVGILLATDFLFIHILSVLHRGFIHLIRGNLALYDGVRELYRRHRAQVAERARRQHERPESGAKPARNRRETPAIQTELALETDPAPVPSSEKSEEVMETGEAGPAEEKTPLDRIRVNTTAPPVPEEESEEDLPFEAVPEIEEATSREHEPIPVAVVDLDTTEEAPAASEAVDEAVEATAAPPAPKPRRRPPRPRRKNLEIEELPADYQYPRFFTKPSISLYDEPEIRVIDNLADQLRATGAQLEETLGTFGIEARVTDVTRGPTITRFELEPAPGVKVSRFLSLADDIALALKAHRVRVEAPIPGKGRVGIEVPNTDRDPVLIRELLESPNFNRGKARLNLALGKDIAGGVMVADLATMPHLLVAGATGAGKTVCVKSLLASLLQMHTPDDLQIILIDPKMVELSIFNDIPHLITPVVTDPRKASVALSWLISEMEARYKLFSDLRVRNIEVYNESVDNGEIEMEGEEEGAETQSVSVIRKLPYIVCIIDELADLMMLARSEVEDSIARLAQLARAVGIHLIIATQRPSVDVLTGVIKANFPARISFQVSSRVDSRCILDEIGAERLIGMGDMLYLPAGQSKPTRIQGAFVSDEEMFALIAYLKSQAPPQYKDEIENFGKDKTALQEADDEADPLLDEAVQVVLDTGQASISMVQRRLRVGYTRAARLIDMMEKRGIVGPHTGSKAREILVSTPDEVQT